MPVYDHTTDPTAFLVFDDRSTFTMSGSQVVGVTNVSAGGGAYNAVVDGGTGVTKPTLGGLSYLHFDGASSLKVPSSSPFDAEFVNTGNTPAGGWGALLVFKQAVGDASFILYKGAAGNNTDHVNLASYDFPEVYQNVNCYRPYTLGVAASLAVGAECGTSRPGDNPNYRDGWTLDRNGAACTRTTATGPTGAAGAGQPLFIGALRTATLNYHGDIYAIVFWNRTPLYHEILATHRYYAARFGLPETLTNQPFALIAESNSESQVIGPAEPGIYDRAIVTLGATANACFNLGRGSRTGADIVYDYSTWMLPLYQYLQSLGMDVAVNMFELINDGYGLAGPASYVSYQALLPPGVRFSTSTVFASSVHSPSFGASGLNPICQANNQVIANGIAHGWPVGLVGNDSRLGVYDASLYSDGLHLSTPGVVLAYPYFATAINASLNEATNFSLTGPATGTVGSASANFTITPLGSGYTGTITPTDGSGGGTFTPSLLSWTSSSAAKTCTYTAANTTPHSINGTPSASLAQPSSITYTATPAVATAFTLTGPITGTVGSPSANFTFTPTGGNCTGTITPTDASGGGTFVPSTLTWSASSVPQTCTYTAANTSVHAINGASSPSLTPPSSINYTASNATAAAFTLTGPTSGLLGSPSANFTFTPTGGVYSGTITPTDASGGGSFSPTSLTWASSSSPKTCTYTAANTAVHAINGTPSPSLIAPSSANYTASNATATVGAAKKWLPFARRPRAGR
jgi:hypothetical protein